ncbi:Hpt domain-containing protein [Acinetobacter sp. MB5]|uniref:Hpt domain-containing protein n=1 Tax=Acinetobacter sp. MB5 TaxID=2069438 RepID=UPI000DD0C75A|nr:Hpt domain-containing protein [Acinetobacter sp. MB5]
MKEILKNLVTTVSLPEDGYLEQDAEILDIFVEELQDILAEFEHLFPLWLTDANNEQYLKDIRRHFHTLKGSGRMVGAYQSGELAWTAEDLLNRVMANTVELTAQMQQFTLACFRVFQYKLYPLLQAQQALTLDLRPLVLLGQLLQQQQPLDAALQDLLTATANLNSESDVTGLEFIDIEQPAFLDAAIELAEPAIEPIVEEVVEQSEMTTAKDTVVLSETLSIYLEEALEHLDTINQYLKFLEPTAKQTEGLIRALHTLKGSSGMAHIEPIFHASANVEHALKAHLQKEKSLSDAETDLLLSFSQFITSYLEDLKQDTTEQGLHAVEVFDQIWYDYEETQQHSKEALTISGLINDIMALNIDHLLDAEHDFEKAIQNDATTYLAALIQESTVLSEHTEKFSTLGLHQLADKLKACYETVLGKAWLLDSDYTFELFDYAHQELIHYFDLLATGQTVYLSSQTEHVLNDLLDWLQQSQESEQPAVAETGFDVTRYVQHLALDQQALAQGELVVLDDQELVDVFLDEADDLLGQIDHAFNVYQQEPEHIKALNHLMRYLHTLKGGANMIQAKNIGLIAHELETIFERLINQQLRTSPKLVTVLRLVLDTMADRIDIIRESQSDFAATATLQTLDELLRSDVTVPETNTEVNVPVDLVTAEMVEPAVTAPMTSMSDPISRVAQRIFSDHLAVDSDEATILPDADLNGIFLEEAEDLLVQLDHDFNAYLHENHKPEYLNVLMRHLHTLKGGANMIQATQIGLIAHELETVYEKLIHKQLQPTEYLLAVLRLAQDQIAERVEIIQQKGIDYPAITTLQVLHELVLGESQSVQIEQNIEPTQIEQEIEPVQAVIETEVVSSDSAEVSEMIQQSFVEETQELIPRIRQLLQAWFDERTNRSLLLQLQRDTHTIKGAARMANVGPVIEIATSLENTFEQFALRQFSSNVYDSLLLNVMSWLEQAIQSGQYDDFVKWQQQLSAIEFIDLSAQLPQQVANDFDFVKAKFSAFVEGDGTEPPSMLGEWDTENTADQSNEMIRISAGLVEQMINLTGENAINRSRIEMGISQFNTTLNEMELAILRLSDQLRRMEGELESQIIAKHGIENSRYTDFDPLEMDQYSSLNQLSKSLAESASDLIDFKVTLADKVRDAEALLLQQSRIQAEMQDGLMRVRLVPFSRIVSRLQRLVRQTSSTLNRAVNLNLTNQDVELDRSILERLVTPLEHMMRNAIDHGIESAEERRAARKPEAGNIEIEVTRQGSDIVVEVRDDGRGIDPSKIEHKARQLGLISPDHNLSQQEILQYIFHSGFTTAKAVTQISGRGVGLDVVQSEIKTLGGHVSIQSEQGRGTTFVIRVPTTVAVSDALMVKVADQQFAIPLTQIERIVRISPQALIDYFASDEEVFGIDGQKYKLRYVSEFVGHQPQPRLSNVGHSLPVLMIKGHNNQTIALLVDQLIGSRAQIVVKPIGQQLSKIDAIGGATILGDGQVCLILDGHNIARRIQSTQRTEALTEQRREAVKPVRARQLVMIVDDSVTVRKVTSRLLERHGYDVVTAKDGVDAIEQIEHIKPDVMLLDIEMPRMDGFEVTNTLRHHAVYRDLPIIMITSRTGEKHRERAFSLGVTHYMGKPFQEADLLQHIEQVLAEA